MAVLGVRGQGEEGRPLLTPLPTWPHGPGQVQRLVERPKPSLLTALFMRGVRTLLTPLPDYIYILI